MPHTCDGFIALDHSWKRHTRGMGNPGVGQSLMFVFDLACRAFGGLTQTQTLLNVRSFLIRALAGRTGQEPSMAEAMWSRIQLPVSVSAPHGMAGGIDAASARPAPSPTLALLFRVDAEFNERI
jgi:hypothetical protein